MLSIFSSAAKRTTATSSKLPTPKRQQPSPLPNHKLDYSPFSITNTPGGGRYSLAAELNLDELSENEDINSSSSPDIPSSPTMRSRRDSGAKRQMITESSLLSVGMDIAKPASTLATGSMKAEQISASPELVQHSKEGGNFGSTLQSVPAMAVKETPSLQGTKDAALSKTNNKLELAMAKKAAKQTEIDEFLLMERWSYEDAIGTLLDSLALNEAGNETLKIQLETARLDYAKQAEAISSMWLTSTSTIDKLTEEKHTLQTDYQTLEETNASLKETLQQLTAEIENLKVAKADVEHLAKDLQESSKVLKEYSDELQFELDETRTRLEFTIEERDSTLKSETEAITAKYELAISQLQSDFNDERDALNAEIRELKKRIVEEQDSKAILDTQCKELKKQSSSSNLYVDDLKAKCDSLEDELVQERCATSSLKMELEKLRFETRVLGDEKEELFSKFKKIEDALKQLEFMEKRERILMQDYEGLQNQMAVLKSSGSCDKA
ncbi:hypothetical protein HDV05_003894 [Chytridiales sp. JEL 0842]|nr:hypothetical protein HDV05_003894 [Chytridiales sp. JEL 0842]